MKMKKCLKIVTYAVNILFVVYGIFLALWGALNMKITEIFDNVYNATSIAALPVLAIVLGFAILVMATAGIVGTLLENYYITILYSVLLLIVTTLQISLVLWIFIKRAEFIIAIDDVVDNRFSMENLFDTLEITFECCGAENYKDYNGNVPNACCGLHRSDELTKCEKNVYTKRRGCRLGFKEYWQHRLLMLSMTGIVISLLQPLVLWIALTLIGKYRNSKKANLEKQQRDEQLEYYDI